MNIKQTYMEQRLGKEEVVILTPIQKTAGRWEAHEGIDYEYILELHTEQRCFLRYIPGSKASRLWRKAHVTVHGLWMCNLKRLAVWVVSKTRWYHGIYPSLSYDKGGFFEWCGNIWHHIVIARSHWSQKNICLGDWLRSWFWELSRIPCRTRCRNLWTYLREGDCEMSEWV